MGGGPRARRRVVSDHRKKSLHLPDDVLAQMRAEAHRLDRPVSWVVQRAWMLARQQIRDDAPFPAHRATTHAPRPSPAPAPTPAPERASARALEPLSLPSPYEPEDAERWPWGEPTL